MQHEINNLSEKWDDTICQSVDRSFRVADLVLKYMLKQISAEEQADLSKWIESGNQGLFQQLIQEPV